MTTLIQPASLDGLRVLVDLRGPRSAEFKMTVEVVDTACGILTKAIEECFPSSASSDPA